MANLQSQIDILAKAVVNEHVRVSNLQSVSVSDVVSNVKVYDMGGIIKNTEDEDLTKEYNHQVYDLKDKNKIIGTFFGYNIDDDKFSGIWCYDNESDYVIDQYGDIVACKDKKLTNLVNKTYVRHLGLSSDEYDKSQIDKNENRMVYIDSKTMNVNINGDIVTYNVDTLSYVSGPDEYKDYTYLDFRDGTVFVLNETNGVIKYPNNGYTAVKIDNNIMFSSRNNSYVYYKSGIIDDAYKNTLKGAIISDSVTSIEPVAFERCPKLQSIIVNKNNQKYSSTEDGILFNNDKTMLVKYTTGKSRSEYEIPETATTIEMFAFSISTNLETIIIGKNVENIFADVFSGCFKLQSFVVDKNNQKYSSTKDGVLITKNENILIKYPAGKSKSEYEIPETIEYIYNDAFQECASLETITIGKNVKNIDGGIFSGCFKLQSFVVDKNNQKYSSTKDGVLFNKDKTILVKYPQGKSRSEYEIPETVTTIGMFGFSECTSLEILTIPNTLTYIDFDAFYECINLTKVYINIIDTSKDHTTVQAQLIAAGIDRSIIQVNNQP